MIGDCKTVKCRFCGELYVFMPHMVGDQQVCSRCRRKAMENMGWLDDRSSGTKQ